MNIAGYKLNLKLLFFPVSIIMLLIILASIALHYQSKQFLQNRLEHELTSIAKTCAAAIRYINQKAGGMQFNDLANNIGTATNSRITIINYDGNVLGDTMIPDNDIIHADNHAMRPEIIEAKERGIGISKRYSNTTKENMLYVATPYHTKKNFGFIRVSEATVNME